VVVFRDRGSAILDIGYTAIAEIRKPESEGEKHVGGFPRERPENTGNPE